jgi:hypothetical protein
VVYSHIWLNLPKENGPFLIKEKHLPMDVMIAI